MIMNSKLGKRGKIAIILPSLVVASLIAIYVYQIVENNNVESKITDLYHKILNRDPDAVGLAYYKDQVLTKGKSLDWVENDLQSSNEARSLEITQLYLKILNREPDAVGQAYYLEQLQNGKSIGWVESSIMNSTEAKSLLQSNEIKTANELNSTTKVTINNLYQEILHREADSQGMQYFGSMLESGKMSANDIRNALLNSTEYKNMNR